MSFGDLSFDNYEMMLDNNNFELKLPKSDKFDECQPFFSMIKYSCNKVDMEAKQDGCTHNVKCVVCMSRIKTLNDNNHCKYGIF